MYTQLISNRINFDHFELSKSASRAPYFPIVSAEREFVNLLSFKEPRNRFPACRAGTRTYLTYRLARLHRQTESIPWIRFLGSLKVYKFGLCTCILRLVTDVQYWNFRTIYIGARSRVWEPSYRTGPPAKGTLAGWKKNTPSFLKALC